MRWADASPALVSKVVSALQKADVRCSVIMPNLLTMRHGFGGSHFKEVNDVEMKCIKSYPGSDMSALKEQLLTAIKNDRAERMKRVKVKTERRAAEEVNALAKLESKVQEEQPEQKPSDESQCTMRSHEVKEQPLEFDVIKNKGLLKNKGGVREGGSTDKENDAKADNGEDLKTGKMNDGDSDSFPTIEAMGKQRLEDFTRSVARAFGRQSMITRQDLVTAPSMLAIKLTDSELAEGLALLEESNKIFISNELVFAI